MVKNEPQEVTEVKYGRTQRKVPPWLVCVSHGACLHSMLPGFQVTARLGFFLCSGCLSDSEDSDSLLLRGLVPKRGLVPP